MTGLHWEEHDLRVYTSKAEGMCFCVNDYDPYFRMAAIIGLEEDPWEEVAWERANHESGFTRNVKTSWTELMQVLA